MKFAIVHISSANIYSEMSEYCTPIAQLLFGQTVEIVAIKKNYLQIKILENNLFGFMLKNQVRILSSKEYNSILNSQKFLTTDSVSTIIINDTTHLLSIGSILYNFDGWVCDFLGQKLHFNGNAISKNQILKSIQIESILKKMINSPYQTGGCSKFGIDSIGLLRLYYRWLNLNEPISIDPIFEQGKSIALVKNAQAGDIVFVGNKEVEHYGILLNSSKIIHVNGFVKIDKIDYLGIYNSEETNYDFRKILKIIRPL